MNLNHHNRLLQYQINYMLPIYLYFVNWQILQNILLFLCIFHDIIRHFTRIFSAIHLNRTEHLNKISTVLPYHPPNQKAGAMLLPFDYDSNSFKNQIFSGSTSKVRPER